MSTQTRPLILVGLLALTVSAMVQGQEPANPFGEREFGEREPGLSQAIARQGNQALTEIRAELRIALQRRSRTVTVSTMAGLQQGEMPSASCACGAVPESSKVLR
ncbi:MAG: hypothetical protein ACT4QA_22105 [Panacagrimonas sp.]